MECWLVGMNNNNENTFVNGCTHEYYKWIWSNLWHINFTWEIYSDGLDFLTFEIVFSTNYLNEIKSLFHFQQYCEHRELLMDKELQSVHQSITEGPTHRAIHDMRMQFSGYVEEFPIRRSELSERGLRQRKTTWMIRLTAGRDPWWRHKRKFYKSVTDWQTNRQDR